MGTPEGLLGCQYADRRKPNTRSRSRTPTYVQSCAPLVFSMRAAHRLARKTHSSGEEYPWKDTFPGRNSGGEEQFLQGVYSRTPACTGSIKSQCTVPRQHLGPRPGPKVEHCPNKLRGQSTAYRPSETGRLDKVDRLTRRGCNSKGPHCSTVQMLRNAARCAIMLRGTH